MKELRNYQTGFRKLFDVKSYPEKELRYYVAISDNGELLYITEELVGMGATDMGIERHFYLLERSEFLERVDTAQRKGKLQKAFQRGYTTPEEIEKLCR